MRDDAFLFLFPPPNVAFGKWIPHTIVYSCVAYKWIIAHSFVRLGWSTLTSTTITFAFRSPWQPGEPQGRLRWTSLSWHPLTLILVCSRLFHFTLVPISFFLSIRLFSRDQFWKLFASCFHKCFPYTLNALEILCEFSNKLVLRSRLFFVKHKT